MQAIVVPVPHPLRQLYSDVIWIEMDIKSWDYVDPTTAKRLLDLERTRNTLQQQHTNLTANNRLHSELKDKLIEQTKKV